MILLLLACLGSAGIGECDDARVELPESPNECSTNQDCAGQGCGGEVCAAVADTGPGVISTCEYQVCFDRLRDCGCDDGVCRWGTR